MKAANQWHAQRCDRMLVTAGCRVKKEIRVLSLLPVLSCTSAQGDLGDA